MAAAVAELAARCDLLYLHVDSDILDERFVPNHGTREPGGPDMGQVLAACDLVVGKAGWLTVAEATALPIRLSSSSAMPRRQRDGAGRRSMSMASAIA